MKNIVIAGGTGLIGSHLSRFLAESGYNVTVLTRNASKYSGGQKITYLPFNIADHNITVAQIEGSYAVINLCGAGVTDKRWTKSYKKTLYDSRLKPVSNLVKAMEKCAVKPKVFISASATGIYGDRGDETLNERSDTGRAFLSELCIAWENEADKRPDDVRSVKARIGIVLAREGGALAKMLPPFRMFLGGSVGSGRQWMSWIHISDLCRMFLWCIENPDVNGAINFVSPNPVTMNDFTKSLGKVISRPSVFRIPSFAARLLLGESAWLALSSQKVFPSEALHLGYEFEYPSLEDGLKNIVKRGLF